MAHDAAMTSIKTLHDQARRAVAAGEAKLREAAELLAKAAELGATQRQSAQAIGKSPAWVNMLLNGEVVRDKAIDSREARPLMRDLENGSANYHN